MFTVSLYNYYIPSVGSRTPFTVSVIRSLPLRAVDAYYIMPQPLTLGLLRCGCRHLYFTTRGLVTGILDILCKYFCQTHFCVGTAASSLNSVLILTLHQSSVWTQCIIQLLGESLALTPGSHRLRCPLKGLLRTLHVRRRWDQGTSASPSGYRRIHSVLVGLTR